MGFVPSFWDSGRVRWSAICRCGRWAPAAYGELCHLGACRPGGWSGSLRQLGELIWEAHGKQPGCKPDRRTLTKVVNAMADAGIISIEIKGAFSTIRVLRQDGESVELGGSVADHNIKRSGSAADHQGVEAQPTTSGGAADHGGSVADHSSEEEASPEGEGEASSEEGGSGPAATLRLPKGGSAADSGSQDEGPLPPCPPSGGGCAEPDRGAQLLDQWQTSLDRANGHSVDGFESDIEAPDPEERLRRTIEQERAQRPQQLTLGVPPEIQAQLKQCSWYTDPHGYNEPPPERKRRQRPRFQAQVVPPPPVMRDSGPDWERRRAAKEQAQAVLARAEESDNGRTSTQDEPRRSRPAEGGERGCEGACQPPSKRS